jgi:hypothetical protein
LPQADIGGELRAEALQGDPARRLARSDGDQQGAHQASGDPESDSGAAHRARLLIMQ